MPRQKNSKKVALHIVTVGYVDFPFSSQTDAIRFLSLAAKIKGKIHYDVDDEEGYFWIEDSKVEITYTTKTVEAQKRTRPLLGLPSPK